MKSGGKLGRSLAGYFRVPESAGKRWIGPCFVLQAGLHPKSATLPSDLGALDVK